MSQTRAHLGVGNRVLMRPDLEFRRRGKPAYVADIKYKLTADANARNADYYQLLAYTTALDLPEGVLIYCLADGGVEHRSVTVRHAGKVLHTKAVDLTGDADLGRDRDRSRSPTGSPSTPGPTINRRRRTRQPGAWAEPMTTIAGLSVPSLSAYDPAAAGEGSLDPMGLAALSDRLADRLVPGARARMIRIRFVTAIAVSSIVCEPLEDELSGDDISTAQICFEWIVLEAFARRLGNDIPTGVPGSQKARNVVQSHQRLSAATYLKGPTVFGFHGVYKPFAVDSDVIGQDYAPGLHTLELVRAWELDNDLPGFADDVVGSTGRNLRRRLTSETLATLQAGRCSVLPGAHFLGRLASTFHPDQAGPNEKAVLRSLLTSSAHEQRNELAELLDASSADTRADHVLLDDIRPGCSPQLGELIDAVTAYEALAKLLDTAFRTLCTMSYSLGTTPLTPDLVAQHETLVLAAANLPAAYRLAEERLAVFGDADDLEARLGEFSILRTVPELVEVLMSHHEDIQARKGSDGKRPWFEPVRDGWVVRAAYGSGQTPVLGPGFVHPVRVETLDRFLEEVVP